MQIQDQIRKQIFDAVKTAYPDVDLKLEDISLEHPALEEHGDYSTNIALKLAKQLGGKKSFLDNIDWLIKNIKKDNFEDFKNPVPVGKFSPEVQKAINTKDKLIYLKPKVYAKVNGWLEGHGGHKEIEAGYWYLLPLFLHRPSKLLRDKRSKTVFHFVIDLKGNLDIIIDLLYWGEDYAQVSSMYFVRDSYLKNFEEIVLDGGTAVPSYLSDLNLTAGFGAGSRLSSLHQNQEFYNTLDSESQEEIAEKIINRLRPDGHRGEVKILNGFINFTLSKEELVEQMNKIEITQIGKGKTVMMDYSAPNIAKRFGIGHLRSTIIGQSLYNIYKFLGYKVIGDNHLGDWGTQFGKMIFMIKKTKTADFSIENLEKLYVEFHQNVTPEMEDQARLEFKKLEDGDKENRALWQKCVVISMEEFNKIYDLLGVKIDFAYGESFYEDKMPAVIKDSQKISKKSDGALIVEIPGMKTPLMLAKSDGGTTYATRDLATLKFRQEQWNPDVIIYEVGAEQTFYFQQVFTVAKMLGYVKKEVQLIHTKHGLYRLESGKFSTRKGNMPKLEEILNEAIKRAKSKAVGIGAIKYFDLKHNVTGDIVFDWENMFAMDGDSGPYLQYTYARAKSVIARSETTKQSSYDASRLLRYARNDTGPAMTSEETAILRWMYRFPEVVEAAAKNYSPNLISSYLFELAKRFNNFYNNCPILENNFRLSLTEATSTILKTGLNLLGIEALEQM